jgi:hypothetical protein
MVAHPFDETDQWNERGIPARAGANLALALGQREPDGEGETTDETGADGSLQPVEGAAEESANGMDHDDVSW